jgi:hypothetical protein
MGSRLSTMVRASIDLVPVRCGSRTLSAMIGSLLE